MSLQVTLSPEAERELEEATLWYEQRAELGESFVERVQEALDIIGRLPEVPARIYQRYSADSS